MSDKNKCTSCGLPYTEHMGLIGTCAELQRMKRRLKLSMAILNLIAENGGKELDGIRCNGSWCSEQATRAIEQIGEIK